MSKCWYCNNELTTGDNPKHFGICNKCYNEMFKSSDTIIRSFTNKISDLETKLAESEKQRQHLKDWLDNEILTSVDSESYYATINEYEEEVKKLKQRLEESEKKFIVANNLRKNSDEVLLNYKTEKYGLDKTIQELRKMKLSLPEKEWYYKGFENCERQMSSHIADLTLEVNELKQQLAEKDKEIEYQENMKILAVDNKNKKAIEQLEKVKDWCKEYRTEDEFGVFTINVDDELNTEDNLLDFIDNQIEKLKKEMK